MPKRSPHPHVSWRAGRPRFIPGPELRATGHQGRDLKHPDGRWFSKGEAVDWSLAFCAGLAATPKPKRGRPVAALPRRLTLGKMVEGWQASPRWQDGHARALSPRTRRDYRQKLKVIEDDFPELWTAPAEAITRPQLQSAYDEIERGRGLATARGATVVLGVAYKWAITRGKVSLAANPASQLDKQMPPPRVRFATRAEITALLAAADALDLPEVGDAIMMGLWTGQRQGDRLDLEYRGLHRGRRVFRQSKTGAIVHVLEAPELEARLAQNRKRRETAERVHPRVILNERTWKPFVEDTYRHDFAKVRTAAAEGIMDVERSAEAAAKGINEPVWRVAACPSVADFHDQDLRDTAVTWMALAGATIPEIGSVTGHSAETVHHILKHYLAAHPELADSAIRKMIAWYDAGGETEIG